MKRLFFNTKRLAAAALCALSALGLAGCGSGTNSFTWYVEELPSNLDPQVAAASADVIACTNLYGGLLRRGPDGQLQNELCESYTVSADGLRYTFRLKPDLVYLSAKGQATAYEITAEDFVFAFRRLFRPETRSPYAADFSALANSAAVLAGELPEASLGVAAQDALTLVFTLSVPDDSFLSKLTLPGAMPCDEEFFNSTKGTYGLTTATTLSSGSFYIYSWTSSGLFLRRASAAPLVDSLRLVQNTTATAMSPEQLILNERCSAALDTGAAATSLRAVSYSDTTWCLLFNCGTVLENTALRQALAAAALDADARPASALYSPAQGLVPDGAAVDGVAYTSPVGDLRSALGDPRALYAQALEELSTQDLRDITLLLPASAGLGETAGEINSLWQKELSLFFSVEEVEDDVFEARLASGSYTIALAPVTMESRDVAALLGRFSSSGLTGYADEAYADGLAQAATVTGQARRALLADCERRLVTDCAAVPLFSQRKRLLLADGVNGLVFDPYGPVLDLTYTTKE